MDLQPLPNKTLRIMGVACCVVLAFIGTTPFLAKIPFLLLSTLCFGTYREFRISKGALKERWTVGFFPLRHRRWKLKRFSKIETNYQPTGILEMLVFGGFAFIYGWIVDVCFPWVGGAYQIWLNNAGDHRILAWQGNSQRYFEKNLNLLKQETDFDIIPR